jgi:hypothetical protein
VRYGTFASAPITSNRDEVPHLRLVWILGAGVTPAEGGVKPTAGFTFEVGVVYRIRNRL